ncbi:MAG: hypothetical protein BWY82_02343 [Verrucomicrobia bacterium ADurb.Bin474]|nr:MAG: hypothetical protein BWY82_02343 [Verrucomicrobia bacterium ADurb.Bin474]
MIVLAMTRMERTRFRNRMSWSNLLTMDLQAKQLMQPTMTMEAIPRIESINELDKYPSMWNRNAPAARKLSTKCAHPKNESLLV